MSEILKFNFTAIHIMMSFKISKLNSNTYIKTNSEQGANLIL